jgi:hypothetical protein
MDTHQLVQAIDRPLYEVGAAWYFTPETLAVGQEFGLGGTRWYLLGRAGVLGDVEAAVVTSAFGYFNHAMIGKLWDSSRAKLGAREAGRRYLACAAEFGRRHLGGWQGADAEDLAAYCDAAEAVVAAADPAGLALFAGVAAEPLPADVAGRALQLSVVLRELRGSVHLLAVVASGITPKMAHALRRPDARAWFGWDPAEEMEATDDDRRRLAAADALTDALLVPAWSVLDDAAAERFVATLQRIHAAVPPIG